MTQINNYSDILVKKYGSEGRWVNWRKEKDKKGKDTKIPYLSKNVRASSTNPKTWRTHDKCAMALDNGSNGFDGVGIVLHDSKHLCVDIDHVLENGEVKSQQSEAILKFINASKTFTEISQSRNGLHLFFELTEPFTPIKKNDPNQPYEVYTNGRYIATTGNSYHQTPLEVRTVTVEEMEELLKIIGYPWGKQTKKNIIKKITVGEPLTDEKLLEKMFTSKNGNKIKSLYDGDISSYGDNDSSADMAMCNHLAFWTGGNAIQMERLWLTSPLGQREKTQERKDYRERTIENAIATCAETYKQSLDSSSDNEEEFEEKKNASKTEKLLKIVLDRNDVILFKDERDTAFISLKINGHREVWKCGSSIVKDLLSYEFYKQYEKGIGSEVIKNVISVLEGKARFGGDKKTLNNRVAFVNGELWYDLTNEQWQSVRISKDGWAIVNETPILFKRYSHHHPQVLPAVHGNIKLILKYINIVSEEQKLLYLVFLVSCFIPDYPHPAIIIFGAQGAFKSTASKITVKVVDPSLLDVSTMPKKNEALVQNLDHHYFTFFDNVSHITEDISDGLCRAVTGGGLSKRKFFTDEDDVIFSFKRCIGINGINNVVTRPDLLERSLLIELIRVEDKNRKNEADLYESFDKDLPFILGGIFDALVVALRKRPDITIENPPRMADFAFWGCAIAEALGYTKEQFLNAYKDNSTKQTEMLLGDNIVATAIIHFMDGKDEWQGSSTKLLDLLGTQAFFENVDTREKYWPKGASILSRRLNELSTSLKQIGLSVTSSTSGTERSIHIVRTGRSVEEHVTRSERMVEQLRLTDRTDGTYGNNQ
jgi:primase-polymerase (primpol)-like protein